MNTNCNFCQQRPKFVEGIRVHDYCGRTCANLAAAARSSQANTCVPPAKSYTPQGNTSPQAGWNPPPPYSPNRGHLSANLPNVNGLCDYCLLHPKAVEGSRVHNYCSKTCAQGHKLSLAALPTAAPTVAPSSIKKTCKFNKCQRPVYTDGNGQSEFCSMNHKTLAETVCILCRQGQKQQFSHFCSRTCAHSAENAAPGLIEVPVGHVAFKSVLNQFRSSWRHSTRCPTVKRVYKIVHKQSFMARYDAYRNQVETLGQFVAKGRSSGNENRRWHGTTRACRLGDFGNTKFCTNSNCSLCSIITNSFQLSKFGNKTGWGRFGAGIYTSSTSSKSNDYSSNMQSHTLKAMLLNKVVVGRGYKMMQDSSSLTTAPRGFDSVLAEVGGSLNHDELIVYTNDAIRPSFLVIYEP